MNKMIHIPTHEELKNLTPAELSSLTEEIRVCIIDAVSASGGHLASNLGVVETTLALHRVFDVPTDSIVFDVGHQCYTHKILTGRSERMHTLRRAGGLSGFPSRAESDADPFTTGHSGTSLSAALGMAQANRLAGRDVWTVAVIGDGSFTNGMIYEALNGCAVHGLKLVIVLNDNEMSISKNVGAMPSYFAKIRREEIELLETVTEEADRRRGYLIDVMPLDGTPDNGALRKLYFGKYLARTG